jgi:hypothetical protein
LYVGVCAGWGRGAVHHCFDHSLDESMVGGKRWRKCFFIVDLLGFPGVDVLAALGLKFG